MRNKMIGQPDLEGILIRIDGQNIPGTDINICPKCAIYALAGIRGFKRTKNIVTVMTALSGGHNSFYTLADKQD